jgi:hypothetical protein
MRRAGHFTQLRVSDSAMPISKLFVELAHVNNKWSKACALRPSPHRAARIVQEPYLRGSGGQHSLMRAGSKERHLTQRQ